MPKKILPKRVLIIEDDKDLANSLKRSFERENFEAKYCSSLEETKKIIEDFYPNFALVDLKINGGSGIEVIKFLKNFNDKIKIVVLTGYASITTTISSIKSGAHYYLAKPANVSMILDAFNSDKEKEDESLGNDDLNQIKIGEEKLINKNTSFRNIEWEYINQTLTENNFNISKTARILNMHRRTLTRKLQKRIIQF